MIDDVVVAFEGLLEIEWAIFGGSDRRKHAGE
jgi:hypothetical protein